MKRKCERCSKMRYCEEIPLMGYCLWMCEICCRAARYIGEVVV